MRFFWNNTVIVSRLKTSSGNQKEYFTTATSEAHIQRLSESRAQLTDGVFGKTFRIWLPVTASVQASDRMTDENGVQYEVQEVYDSTFGAQDFRECLIKIMGGPND